MKKQDLIDKIILESAGCTNWSHRELVERIIMLAEWAGMEPPRPSHIKLYRGEPDGTISPYKSKWEE